MACLLAGGAEDAAPPALAPLCRLDAPPARRPAPPPPFLQADRVVSQMEMEGLGSLDAKSLNAALGLPPPLRDDTAGEERGGGVM